MLSVRKAANILGVKSYVLYVLIKKKFIDVDRETLYGAEQTVRVRQEEIEKFKAAYTFSNLIARTYHISQHHLLFLIMDQGFMPVSGPLIDGGRQYVFKTADIESLDIAKLISKEKTAKSGNMRESKLLTTEQAAKLVCLRKKEILKFIRSGALNPFFPPKSKRRKGTRLYFATFDVERFKERHIDAPGVLSAGEAAKMLKEDLSWFYKKWVKTGRMKTVNFKDKLGKHYFRQEDVEAAKRLKESTMTGPEAAKILGVHRNIVTKWRKKDKLRAISGPEIDGFGCHLYLRKDIRRMERKRALHYTGQQELVFEA